MQVGYHSIQPFFTNFTLGRNSSTRAESAEIFSDHEAGKDWRQKEKGEVEDKMEREHHWLNGHEFEQILEDSGGEKSLLCCSPWDPKESEVT